MITNLTSSGEVRQPLSDIPGHLSPMGSYFLLLISDYTDDHPRLSGKSKEAFVDEIVDEYNFVYQDELENEQPPIQAKMLAIRHCVELFILDEDLSAQPEVMNEEESVFETEFL